MSKTFAAGLRQETKAKFDALLKSALRNKDTKTKSKQNLVENPSSSDEEVISYKDDSKSKHADSISSEEEISYNKNKPENEEEPVKSKKRSIFQMKIVNELKKNKLFKLKSKQSQNDENKRTAGSAANLVMSCTSDDEDDDNKLKQKDLNLQDDVSVKSETKIAHNLTERPMPKPRGAIDKPRTVKVTSLSKYDSERSDEIDLSDLSDDGEWSSKKYNISKKGFVGKSKIVALKPSHSDETDESTVNPLKNKTDNIITYDQFRKNDYITHESRREPKAKLDALPKSVLRNRDARTKSKQSLVVNLSSAKSKSAQQKSLDEPTTSTNRSKSTSFYNNDIPDTEPYKMLHQDSQLKVKQVNKYSIEDKTNMNSASISDSSESNPNMQFENTNTDTFKPELRNNQKTRLKNLPAIKQKTGIRNIETTDSDDSETKSGNNHNVLKSQIVKLNSTKVKSKFTKVESKLTKVEKFHNTSSDDDTNKHTEKMHAESQKICTIENNSVQQTIKPINKNLDSSIDEHSKQSNEETSSEDEIVQVHTSNDLSVENKTYIMDKFLNDSSQELSVGKKHPVPKPRQARSNSTQSSGTYVALPKSPPKARRRSKKNEDIELATIRTKNENEINETDGKRITDSDSETVEKNKTHNKIDTSEENEIERDIVDYKIENERSKTKRGKKSKTVVPTTSYDYKHIVGVVVHRTDRLLLDSYVVHPVVKVHIVDSKTGEYLMKSNADRNVLFYYENKSINYIGAIMTESYNLQQHRSMYPNWEELILINDDFDYITGHSEVIFFFEIMDFLSVSLISNYNNHNGSLGWHRIAWAFLRPSGPNFSNVNTKLRLQLYRPRTPLRNCPANKCDIFNWWAKKKFDKYPSTLHVSIKPTSAVDRVVETWRSKTPHEIECGRKKEFQENNDQTVGVVMKSMNEIDNSSTKQWVRLENQTCKLPNKCIARLDSYDEGCFVMKFSNNGRVLACGIMIDNTHTIVVYSVLSFELVTNLFGHQGLIYCINWSSDDKIMISASADCTVCVWDATNFIFLQILPHPSFVYTSEIKNDIIVSGCYDNVLRVWERKDETEYELRQELKGHEGYITSVCFNKDAKLLFSADSMGVITIWKLMEGDWIMRRKIAIIDLKGTAIDQILLHKRGRRLLVNSRDGKIRLVDIKTGYVLQTHNAGLNNRVRTTCTLSPCMSYILAGSVNGALHVWNTDTAIVEAVYYPYDHRMPIHCVQYHPKDDYLVISHYGSSLPILLYKHDSVENTESIVRASTRRSTIRKESEKNEGSVDFRQILKKMDHLITPSVSNTHF